jgi:hypothetical protein
MKKFVYTLTAFLPALFVSCNDLEVTPVGQLSGSNFPVSDGDAVALTNAVYYPNIRISTALGYLIDLTTELEANAENTNSGGYLLGVMQWEPNNSYVTSVWDRLYDIVTRANDVVDKVGTSEQVSPALRERLVGEAKFLRAYAYFYLVQLWGEVPLVLHNVDGDKTPRTSVGEIYGQIVADLEEAAESLPHDTEYGGADRGRASQGAAYAYLAKVYLVWGQTDDAADNATKKQRYGESVRYAGLVTGYSLEENFADNWSKTNRNGKEAIFSVQHLQGEYAPGDGGNHLVHCAFANGYSNGVLPHVYATSDKWYEDFDDRDQRKRVTYVKRLYDPTGDSIFVFDRVRYGKYVDTTDVVSSANTRDINRTVIRYAEVLLLKAEAINERDGYPNAEAYEAVNEVRRRAFRHFPVTAPSPDDLPQGLDYAAFKERIQQERVFELTYEQNRWTDLVRWRILVKTLKETVSKGYIDEAYRKQDVRPHYYRFPIPKGERDINPDGLWQNYGYNGYDRAKTGDNPYRDYESGWTN